ncbi:MAG: hypothetical protein AAF743_07265 [Planctomycetota bacterium]
MKILLDNCVPKRAKRLLSQHTVQHTSELGLGELGNGKLIQTAADLGFDVLLTVDQNIRREHNLAQLPIAIIELYVRDTRFPALIPLEPHFEDALAATGTHRFVSLALGGAIERLAER